MKEEFARSRQTESPDTTSTEDSNQSPLASPFDPMLWAGSLNDLEIDAAPSLRHPSQSFVTRVEPTPPKQSHTTPDSSSSARPPSHSGSVSALFQRGGVAEGQVDLELVPKSSRARRVASPTTGQDRKDKSTVEDCFEFDTVDGLIPDTGQTSTDLTAGESADEAIADSCGTASPAQSQATKLEDAAVHSDDNSAREEQSDTVHSPTILSETTASEGFRTDEGFSEVSEEAASVKEEALPKKIEMQETVAPPKAKSKKEGEI